MNTILDFELKGKFPNNMHDRDMNTFLTLIFILGFELKTEFS